MDGYVAGAPPESCDTMLPIHMGNGFDDCSLPNLCPTVTIVGVDIVDNMFEYNCSQNYTSEVLCLAAYTVQLSVSFSFDLTYSPERLLQGIYMP